MKKKIRNNLFIMAGLFAALFFLIVYANVVLYRLIDEVEAQAERDAKEYGIQKDP